MQLQTINSLPSPICKVCTYPDTQFCPLGACHPCCFTKAGTDRSKHSRTVLSRYCNDHTYQNLEMFGTWTRCKAIKILGLLWPRKKKRPDEAQTCRRGAKGSRGVWAYVGKRNTSIGELLGSFQQICTFLSQFPIPSFSLWAMKSSTTPDLPPRRSRSLKYLYRVQKYPLGLTIHEHGLTHLSPKRQENTEKKATSVCSRIVFRRVTKS